MIISFRFKNNRSFFDETFIDMRAVNYKEHPDHLLFTGSQKLIKTLAIYGANASGKTNLLLAFSSFHAFIFSQLSPTDNFQLKQFMTLLQLNSEDLITPFHGNELREQPTEMELTFMSGEHLFEFGFSVLGQEIMSEHLIMDNHVVYTRTGPKLTFGRKYNRFLRQKCEIPVHSSRLFCSLLSSLSLCEAKEIMKPFEQFFSAKISYYFDYLVPFQMAGNMHISKNLYKMFEEQEAISYALEQLRRMGIPAEKFIIEKGILKLGYRYKSRTTGEEEIHYIEHPNISTGTMKCLQLFVHIYILSQKGGALIVDNISNDFHPTMTKFLIDFIQNEENKNVQLIFTTYDTSILNNLQFRRDEVAFVDINKYQESRLYTLADIKVRSDASFSKDYLLGKYGAIPILKEE